MLKDQHDIVAGVFFPVPERGNNQLHLNLSSQHLTVIDVIFLYWQGNDFLTINRTLISVLFN